MIGKFTCLTLGLLFALLTDVGYAGSATWKPHPVTGDWNNAANWKPRTIPNGSSDIATFAVSAPANVFLNSAQIEVDRVVFGPGASAFNISGSDTAKLLFSGVGIENNSGMVQNFITNYSETGALAFTNQATAGTQTKFTAIGDGSEIDFYDEASASSADFTLSYSTGFDGYSPVLVFYDTATAASATVRNVGGFADHSDGGDTKFFNDSTAANATITNNGGLTGAYAGGQTSFYDNSTAGDSIITNEATPTNSNYGGATFFNDDATAANAIITCNGAAIAGGGGFGALYFFNTSFAGNATLIANGGSNGGAGGLIQFYDDSDAGQARVELFANGTLDITNGKSSDGVSVGSLEGDGIVSIGTNKLTIGRNNLSTEFSGVIQGSGTGTGTVVKEGSGTLTLSGANTYLGYTVVNNGFLRAENRTGSATGSGAVVVYNSTIGGSGIIGGSVILNSLGVLAPGSGATTLTVKGNLTFNASGSYTWRVKTSSARADKVTAARGVRISFASFTGIAIGNTALSPGTTFTAVENTSRSPINGTFDNLTDGGTITIGNNTFQANYEGGDGNDLTLTVLP